MSTDKTQAIVPMGEIPRRTNPGRVQQDQSGVRYIYPICSRCQRPVEAFCWSDHRPPGDILSRRFFAYCHGDTETVCIPLDTMAELIEFRIEYAFADEGRQLVTNLMGKVIGCTRGNFPLLGA